MSYRQTLKVEKGIESFDEMTQTLYSLQFTK